MWKIIGLAMHNFVEVLHCWSTNQFQKTTKANRFLGEFLLEFLRFFDHDGTTPSIFKKRKKSQCKNNHIVDVVYSCNWLIEIRTVMNELKFIADRPACKKLRITSESRKMKYQLNWTLITHSGPMWTTYRSYAMKLTQSNEFIYIFETLIDN